VALSCRRPRVRIVRRGNDQHIEPRLPGHEAIDDRAASQPVPPRTSRLTDDRQRHAALGGESDERLRNVNPFELDDFRT